MNYFWWLPSTFVDMPDKMTNADSTTLAVLKQLPVSWPMVLEYEKLEWVKGIEASPKRQFVPEPRHNNCPAYPRTWSTVKTLPATLPKPKIRDPRCHGSHQNTTAQIYRALDQKPRLP